jgi:hypothetical protein
MIADVEPPTMWMLGLGTALLPFLLAVVFNGRNTADARGRRHSRRWG